MDTNPSNPQPEAPADVPEIDPMKVQMLMQQIRDNQNLSLAVLGGAVAALVGAVVWAAVTVATNWQIGFMAVGIGFLVGYVVRRFGQGIDMSFGVVGAVLSLVGCMAGNYLSVCAVIADHESVGFFEVLLAVDLETAIDLMVESFDFMDLLFYGLALYYGYKYSFYQLSEEEMASTVRR